MSSRPAPNWLRGPVDGIPHTLQPAAHALLEARDEVHEAVEGLPAALLRATPGGAASLAFHLFHLAGALDRLYAYAREEPLSEAHRADLAQERDGIDPSLDAHALLQRVDAAIERALAQLRSTDPATLHDARFVGRARLPSSVFGLLFHGAEHSVRHAGQVVTTAKIVRGTAG